MMSIGKFAISLLGGADELGLPTTSSDASVLENILSIVFLVLGALSVIFIIFGGFKYVTSTGNPERATEGRQTILYALIGLVIAVSAFAIVRFVIARTGT